MASLRDIKFLIEHQGTALKQAIEDSEDMLEILGQQIADAEQCVQSEHQGQNTIVQVFPGDWLTSEGRSYWVCKCVDSFPINFLDNEECPYCHALRPDNRIFLKPPLMFADALPVSWLFA